MLTGPRNRAVSRSEHPQQQPLRSRPTIGGQLLGEGSARQMSVPAGSAVGHPEQHPSALLRHSPRDGEVTRGNRRVGGR